MSNGGIEVIKRTLVARSGNRFKLDRALRKNVWLMGEPKVETLFPLFSGENISDVPLRTLRSMAIKPITETWMEITRVASGYRIVTEITMRKVTARNYNGDGD